MMPFLQVSGWSNAPWLTHGFDMSPYSLRMSAMLQLALCVVCLLLLCLIKISFQLPLQVYKGGIGSYGLIVMVAAFLLLYPARAPAGSLAEGEICNLGELLVDFFRLYGRTMNTNMVGVSCR